MTAHCRLTFLLLGLFCARLATAQDFGKPLTQAQVDCEERQSMRLAHRFVLYNGGSNLFLWRSAPVGGVYRGLAAASLLRGDNLDPETWTREERQMAFDMILRQEESFLDPARLRLPQATLVRRDAATNLMANPESWQLADLRVDLAPEVPNPFEPQRPLQITNRLTPGAGQSDGAGRSLASDDLLSACHTEVTEFDLKVFSILARTVRPSACLFIGGGCGGGEAHYKSVLFRGPEPLTYRMNLIRYSQLCFEGEPCFATESTLAFVFHLQVDQRGNLTGGDVQLLEWCTADDQLACNTVSNPGMSLFVMPPVRPGIDKQGPPEFRRSAQIQIYWESNEDNVLHANVNWADLLRDTAWNGGLVP
jgi:hypothetical protein